MREDIRRDAGQLLWIGFDGVDASDSLRRRLAAGEAGAAVLFRRNLQSMPQLSALTRSLHSAAPASAPLLIAVDQEGGRVQRVRAPATEWPPMLRLGDRAASDPDAAERLAERVGRAIGDELAAVGFDIDFAPVLDVHTNPANPVIGDRAFATTPEMVARLAGAFARGLAAAGILGCGKHFPGHGDTSTDSHLELPRVDHSMQRLRAVELHPFGAVRLPMIMTAHVVFGALDPTVPATLSERVLQDLLRGELGYDGVIVSDDLEMKAVADHFGLEEMVERALVAGCDTFLLCEKEELQHRALAALVRAAEAKSAVRDRLAQAASRVAALKRAHFATPRPPMDPSVLGRPEHHALVDEMRG